MGIVLLVRLCACRLHLLRDLVFLAEQGIQWTADLKTLSDFLQHNRNYYSENRAALCCAVLQACLSFTESTKECSLPRT